MTCACGHVMDEHEYRNGHYCECGVEDCECILFDPAREEDGDEE